MMELAMFKKILALIENDTDLSSLSESDLEDLRRPNYEGISSDYNAVDFENKRIVNTLILKYGIVGSINKLLEFQHYFEKLDKERDVSRFWLLIMTSKSLRARVEAYLEVAIAQKFVKWVTSMVNTGSVDAEAFISDICREPDNVDYLLGLEVVPVECEQACLWDEDEETVKKEDNGLFKAVVLKLNIKDEVVRCLNQIGSKDEVRAAAKELLAMLKNDKRSKLYSPLFSKQMQYISKSPRRVRKKVDIWQQKMPGL